MAKRRPIGKLIASWHYLVFIFVLFVTAGPASLWLGSPGLGLITAFDLAATIFLLLCLKLLRIDDPALIKNIANKNDANRTALLVITAIVTVACAHSGRIGNNWPAPLDIDQGADHPDPNHLLVVQ